MARKYRSAGHSAVLQCLVTCVQLRDVGDYVMSTSIQVEQRDNPSGFGSILARLQQEAAVVEGKADDLLHSRHDVFVADPAAQGQLRNDVCSTLNSNPPKGHCRGRQHETDHMTTSCQPRNDVLSIT